MLRISIENLKPGMVVGKNVHSADGQLLLSAGVTLTSTFIKRLSQLTISSVYIQHGNLPELKIPEILREETRVQTIKNIHSLFSNLHIEKRLDIEQINPTVQAIVNEILQARDTMIHLTDIRLYDDYTFAHSVNVCVLATFIASTQDYSQARLEELATGALLHDIGKILIPADILNKPGRLSDEEMSVMKQHSELGFELLRKSASTMSVVPMHVAFQHQEKFDGSGYPRGLREQEIHEYARIVAIADVYDALTSDRPYRKGMSPYQAYKILANSINTHFDGDILERFLTHIAVYPVGSVVQLNIGYYGIVVSVPPRQPFKPTIRIIADSDRNILSTEMEINLIEQLTISVAKILSETEVLELWEKDI